MEVRLLGWPGEAVDIELDHTNFAYAGKITSSSTGTAVLESGNRILAAASFDRNRTQEDQWWIRYITVHVDHRGKSYGPQLLSALSHRLLDTGTSIRIGVTNPVAYHASYKAGFEFTGKTVGRGEVVLERPPPSQPSTYREGLQLFEDRELPAAQSSFIAEKLSAGRPSNVSGDSDSGMLRDE